MPFLTHRREWKVRNVVEKTALWCLVFAFLLSAPAFPERESVAADSPGIDEKLGATIPLDIELNDETGQKLSLRQLVDKPTVLTLNYFRCTGICTPQLTDLARTLGGIDLEPGKDFQVVTVSFDSTDTFEIAARKRENYLKMLKRPFPPAAWRFLTGDEASTKALADAVGFHFTKRGETFVHPAALIAISPKGKVTRYLYGTTYLPADLAMAVKEAAQGYVRPTISKALSLCFSYDPEGRRYVLNVTRVAGLATLLFVGVFALAVLLRRRAGSKVERLPS
jgi:protein SCO1/2